MSAEAGQNDPLCVGCGYSLVGCPASVCPECGRAFDPNDPRTVAHNQREVIARRMFGPPGFIMATVAVVAGAWELVIASAPFEPFWRVIAPVHPLVAIVLLAWLAKLAHSQYMSRRSKRPASSAVTPSDRPSKPKWRRWAFVPAILVVSVLVGRLGLARALRFELSRPAMEAFAKHVMAQPPGTPLPREKWLGLLHFSEFHRDESGVLLLMDQYGFLHAPGFAYFPDGPPVDEVKGYYPASDFTHHHGDWYTFWVDLF